MPLHIETPLIESAALGGAWLKMESAQPVGSFKIRGIGALCEKSKGASRFVCSSGGNAGYAAAYAGRKLGVPVTVVVPKTTSQASRARILSEGAEIIEHGESWDDAHARALSVAGTYIHPFDDPAIWAGHSTLIDEVARTGLRPGAVVVAVGGGGLLSGVLGGMHRAGWKGVPVLAAETEGAASYAASLKAGKLVTLEKIETVATTLGARTVAAGALAWSKRHTIIPWVVSDRSAVGACLRFADDHRVLVEPACGAALSAVYEKAQALQGRGPVLVVVCGGAGVTLESLRASI